MEISTQYTEVLFSEVVGPNGSLGLITLNRPSALNSLTDTMIQSIHQQLQNWSHATHIKAVVICATEGRAFCAGGDLRLAYHRFNTQDPALFNFFRDEYQLNAAIYHFEKPYIALLDGITMGGGVGISIHGSHRVATDKLVFAMPETGIGFFPDVGGTYFLPRLPARMGFYLGLTGARLGCDECVQIGLVQHKVASEDFPNIIKALAANPLLDNPHEAVSKVLHSFQIEVAATSMLPMQSTISECFARPTMENILQALEQVKTDFSALTIELLKTKSPTSLKVSLQAMQRGQQLNFDECMQQEYWLTSHFLQAHDFIEGIRALLIDKDQKPYWRPESLQEVSEKMVDAYFTT